jgi:5-methylcytosine-specific restriction endonuclease McrA
MIINYREIAFKHFPHKCSKCGKKEELQVHHKDGNRNNNVLSNLQIVCSECHRKIHGMNPPKYKINTKYKKGTKKCHKKK